MTKTKKLLFFILFWLVIVAVTSILLRYNPLVTDTRNESIDPVWIAWLVVVLSSSVLRHKLDRTLERQIFFKGMTFPIVRRVFPNLLVDDIVSVQPMSKPSSTLFYFQYPSEHNDD